MPKPSDAELLARLFKRSQIEDHGYLTPCWTSNRARQANGYTKIGILGKTCLAHRVAYEAARGPIPEGLVIDHLCRNRACVNPEHLEAVTMRENLVRGETVTAAEVAQTHCKRGHKLNEENTYHRLDRLGRICRLCARQRSRRYYREARVGQRYTSSAPRIAR